MAIRIEEASDRELVLRLSARNAWILGFIIFAVGVILMAALARKHNVVCNRAPAATAQCRISHSGFLAAAPRSFGVNELRGARLEDRRDSDGDRVYRVTLQTSQGNIPLTHGYSSGRANKQRVVTEIQSFVHSPEQVRLSVAQDDRLSGLGLGGIFAAIGLLLSLLTRFGTIRFTTVEDRVEFRLRNLIGQEKNMDIPLAEIDDATVERSRSSKGKDTYRVALVRRKGENVPLTEGYTGRANDKEQVARAIRSFLASRKAALPAPAPAPAQALSQLPQEDLFPDISEPTSGGALW